MSFRVLGFLSNSKEFSGNIFFIVFKIFFYTLEYCVKKQKQTTVLMDRNLISKN